MTRTIFLCHSSRLQTNKCFVNGKYDTNINIKAKGKVTKLTNIDLEKIYRKKDFLRYKEN